MVIVCYLEIAQIMYLSCQTYFEFIKDNNPADVNGRRERTTQLPAVSLPHRHLGFSPLGIPFRGPSCLREGELGVQS